MKWMKLPNEDKHMLVFLSTPGIGKTHLISALAEWMVENFDTYKYHSEEKVHERLHNFISEGGHGGWSAELKYITDDEIVAFDDVGYWWNKDKITYKDNEWKIEVFYEFLNTRYNSMMPTIITSNLTREQFETVYSPRIASRLFSEENTIIEIFDKTQDMRAKGL